MWRAGRVIEWLSGSLRVQARVSAVLSWYRYGTLLWPTFRDALRLVVQRARVLVGIPYLQMREAAARSRKWNIAEPLVSAAAKGDAQGSRPVE